MKSTPLAVFAALVLGAFCAFSPGPASAQARDVFAVAGVQVDETAANSAEAQQLGFASAQRLGFERLVRRLTPASEQTRPLPQIDQTALERLVLSVDVEQERRSGTRYIGRLTVRFDPNGVRSLLRQSGFSLVENRASPMLVAPVITGDAPPETAALWRSVWTEGGFSQELAPLEVAPEALAGEPDWTVAQPFAAPSAAASALYATLRVQGATATATLIEVGPATGAAGRRDRGRVSAAIAGTGEPALRAALQSIAAQANEQIQNEWKGRSSGAGQRQRVSASVLYANQGQWEQIKEGLEGAAATLISEIRIEAVGRDGALVSFSYVGDVQQLGAELNRRGVSLEQGPSGPVLRVRR